MAKQTKLHADPIINFISEFSKNIVAPWNMSELSREFKRKTGSPLTQGCVNGRILAVRDTIHKIDSWDVGTRGRILFAMSAPVDEEFLDELRTVAEVELDDRRRISRYKPKGGGLALCRKELIVKVPQLPKKSECELRGEEMLEFLAEKSKTVNTPLACAMKEFKTKTGCSVSLQTLGRLYNRLKRTIHESPKWDKNTKIKMMFISSTKLSLDVLQELRKDAHVDVDREGRISRYSSKDGSLELAGALGNSSKNHQLDHSIAEVEDEDFDFQWESRRRRPSEAGTSEAAHKKPKISEKSSQGSTSQSSISLLHFLRNLRRSAINPSRSQKLDREIKRLEAKDEDVPINVIRESLELYLQILTSPDEMGSGEEMISLSDVLRMLSLSLSDIPHSSINSFRENLRGLIGTNNQKIPSEKDSYAIEKILEKLVGGVSKDDEESLSVHEVKNDTGNDFDYEHVNNGIDVKQEDESDEESEIAFTKIVRTTRNPSREASPEDASISIKTLLVLLRLPLADVVSSSLTGALENIDSKIKLLENSHERVGFNDLEAPLDLCLNLLMKNGAPKCSPEDESTSLRDFLISLRTATRQIANEELRQKLEMSVLELSSRDKRIPVRVIKSAMSIVLSCVAP